MKNVKLFISLCLLVSANSLFSQALSWAKQAGSTGAEVAYSTAIDFAGDIYTCGTFSGTCNFDPTGTNTSATSLGGTDIFIIKRNAAGVFQWLKTIGNNGNDVARCVSVDNFSSSIYITGSFNGVVDFDPSAGVTSFTSSSVDAFVLKLGITGTFAWAKTFTGAESTIGNGIVANNNVGVYVTGSFTGIADFSPAAGSNTLTTGGTGLLATDCFITKLDVNGNFVWAKGIGTLNYSDSGNDIAIDNSTGDIYVGGTISGNTGSPLTVDIDPGAAVYNVSAAAQSNLLYVKFDGSGNFLLGGTIGGAGDDYAQGINLDASGAILLTGYGNSTTIDLNPGAAANTFTSTGGNDIIVVKLTSAGTYTFGGLIGSFGDDRGQSITSDNTNNMYLTGAISNTVDLNPGTGTDNHGGAGGFDIFQMKLSSTGTYVWGIDIGGTGNDFAYDVAANSTGITYNCGQFTGVVDFDPDLAVTNMTSSGLLDAYLFKLLTCASPTIAVTGNTTTCSSVSTSLTASGATSYSWNTGSTAATVSVAPTSTTVYTVTGTSGACSSVKTVTVNVTTSPTVAVNNASVCPGSAASLNASGATTYSWNTGATTSAITVTPAVTTNYTVTGTTSGCTNTKTVSVTVKPTPTVSVSNATICSGASATLTANGAVNYIWSTTATTSSIVVSPTVNTTYSVIGTNSVGCTQTKTVSVTLSASPTVAVSNATTCSGIAVNLLASGATTYSWNTGATTASISVTPTVTSNYTVTGTSAGCTNTKTLSVTVNPSPTVAVSGATICNGSNAIITASGATTYSWNTGVTTASISVTPTTTTTYTVVGTTAGCANTKTVSVLVNTLPNVSVSSSTICAGSTGTLVASGASTYTWNTGATGANFAVNPTVNTNYTVTGTSAAGCVKTATASVTVGSAPSIAANSTSICVGSSVTITASGVNTYTWNTSSNSPSITVNPTSTTVYTVSGNLAGCSTTAVKVVTVTVNSLPVVTLGTISSPLCVNNTAVTLSGSPAGGVYSGTGVTGSNFDPSLSGAGTFIVMYNYTDVNSCSSADTKSVIVNSLPVVTLGIISSPLCVNNAAVPLSGSPAGGIYSGTGVSGSNFDPFVSGAGTFTITYNYTDANSCSALDTKTVNVSLCTSLMETAVVESNIVIYPNPASENVFIEIENAADLQVIDVLGKVVLESKLQNLNNTIDISHLNNGIYYFKIKRGDASVIKKIIKNK